MSYQEYFGVKIEKGPQEWQIIQQKDGYADINLSGRLYFEQLNGSERIFARIVDENTGIPVCSVTHTKVRDNYTWGLTLRQVPAGGLYRIETCMRYDVIKEIIGDRIHHIGVGDLYVIAGQSNAVGVGKDTIYDPVELGIHMFKASGKWDIASHPLADNTGTVHPVNREGAQVGHSPWLNFARTVRNRVHYPIGLVPTAVGGVPLAFWHLAEDGRLYRNMLEIINSAGGKARGILWYQGCNDASPENAPDYFTRFRDMVEDMRRDIGDSSLPIFTVQLNKATCRKNHPRYYENDWALIREAQRQAAQQIPGVYVVPSVDLKVCDGIHNSAASNMVIGERVGKMALGHLYGIHTLCDAPNVSEAHLSGEDEVTVTFDHVSDRINCDLIRLEQFPLSVSDELGVVSLADYDSARNRIILKLTREPVGESFLSCAREVNPLGIMPYDTGSYLPILPFYKMGITR